MRSTWWPSVRDGLFTGAAIAMGLTILGQTRGEELQTIGGWLFLLGATVIVASFGFTIAGRRSPPGLLGLLRDMRPEPEPGEGRSFWMDRVLSTDNTWLIIGLTITAIAFLPPFLGLGGSG